MFGLETFFWMAVVSGLVAIVALDGKTIPRPFAGAGIALMLTNTAVFFHIIPFPSTLFYVIIALVGMWLLEELFRRKWYADRGIRR